MSAKRGRGSAKEPIQISRQNTNESQDSQHSLLDHLDALNVEVEPIVRVVRARSNSGTRRASSSPHAAAAAAAAAAVAVAVAIQKLSVKGYITEHRKSGHFIAPPNAVFVFDNSDISSKRVVEKKMKKIRNAYPDEELYEFNALGTSDMLPTAVAGATQGVLTANLTKCFEASKRAKESESD
jgi:hypothetical protein